MDHAMRATMMQVRKTRPLEIKAVDQKGRRFTGLASTWDVDLDGERMQKGCFRKSLNDWKASKGKRLIPLIDQHDYGSVRSVFGKAELLEETDEGLLGTWSVVNTPEGDEYLGRIADGFVNGLSIGFQTVGPSGSEDVKDAETGVTKKIRVIKEVKLMEVSAVIWGANPEALVDTAAVKALLAPAKNRALTPTERAELDEAVKMLTERLEADPASTPPDPTPKKPEPEEPAEQKPDAEEEQEPDTGTAPEVDEIEKDLAAAVEKRDRLVALGDYTAAEVQSGRVRGIEALLKRKRREYEKLAAEIAAAEKGLEDARAMKAVALGDEDYDAAAVLRTQERGLEARLERLQKQLAEKGRRPDRWTPEDPVRLEVEALISGLKYRASVA